MPFWLLKGDISQIKADAIVNSADTALMGGGAGDSTDRPAGYSAVGRLYAIGYLKGLLEMSGCPIC